MRRKNLSKPKRKRARSYILSEEQFEWMKAVYPYFTCKNLSNMLFEKFGIEMKERAIADMGYRNVWLKNKTLRTHEGEKRAEHMLNVRWGYVK